jgi:hypothetical protein
MRHRRGILIGAVLVLAAGCALAFVSVVGVSVEVTEERMGGTWSCDNGLSLTLRADHTFAASSMAGLAGERTPVGTLDFSEGSGEWTLGAPTGESQPTPMVLTFTSPRSFPLTIQVAELNRSAFGYETGFSWGGADEGSGGCTASK